MVRSSTFAKLFGAATVAGAAGYGATATMLWRRFERGDMDARFPREAVEADPSLAGLLNCWYASPGQLSEPHAVRPPLMPTATANRDDDDDGVVYDACVIGGGVAGLHTAVALAEKGKRVCLLEAKRIGSGASGRSGGQLLCAFEDDSELIAGLAGDDVAKAMVQDSIKLGTERTVELINKYKIDCMHTKTDHVLSCCFAKGPAKNGQTIDEAVDDANNDLLERFKRFGEKWTARQDLADMGFVSERFVYATQSTEGSELNPMSMCFGLARVVEQLGGTIHENSPVATVYRPSPASADSAAAATAAVVTTANGGVVRARDVVLATGSAPASISKTLAACTTKMTTGILVTKPYPDPSKIAAVLKPGVVVFDERYFMNYFRVVGDNQDRILFGGLGCALPQSDESILDELVPEFHKTFPSLMPDFAVDFVWQGQMNMRYPACPLVGREGDGNSPAGGGRRMWYSLAFGGHGLAPAAAAGSLIAAAIVDEQEATASRLGHAPDNTARDRLTMWQQYTHVPSGIRSVVPSLPLFGTWVGCLGVDVTAMKLRWQDRFAGRCD